MSMKINLFKDTKKEYDNLMERYDQNLHFRDVEDMIEGFLEDDRIKGEFEYWLESKVDYLNEFNPPKDEEVK